MLHESQAPGTLFDYTLLEHRAYWLARVPQTIEPAGLSPDYLRPQTFAEHTETEEVLLDEDVCQKLLKLTNNSPFLLYTALLAAVNVCLYRYSGRDSILVGSPARRQDAQEANLLAIVNHLDEHLSFRELLLQVRQTLLEAYARQRYPFAQLIRELGREQVESRSPLCAVLLILEEIHTPVPAVNADLVLTFGREAGRVCGRIAFSNQLFSRQTIQVFGDHLRQVLSLAVDNPALLISEIGLSSASEQRQVLREWNATAVTYPSYRCLHELVAAQAARTPDAIALVFEQEQVSYRVLEHRSTQLAHCLRRRGVGLEQRVGICLERSPALMVGLLGILKAGGAYVPLDPGYPAERVAFLLQDGQVALVLTQRALDGRIPVQSGVEQVILEDLWEELVQAPETALESGVRLRNLAYVIYTSGSTGRPKGVMNTHGAIINRLLWMQSDRLLERSDWVLQKTPYSFDASIWELFAPLMLGGRVVMARPGGQQDSAYLVRVISEQQITVLQLVPSMLRVLLAERHIRECVSLRALCCGGEALALDLQERFFASFSSARLYNFYGPTEASIDTTSWECQRAGRRCCVPIGRPLANMQVYVLDARLRPVPIGVAGELYLGGVGLARGYLGQPELTAGRFVPHPFSQQPGERLYRSGDRVRMRADGALEFLGRLDQQVKLRGFRIEPGEIEASLRQHPQVREAVVVVREEGGDRQLVAYLVASPAGSELRAWLAARLPGYLLPTHLVMLDALPLLPNGKLDRRALPAPSLREDGAATYQAPRTPIEELLAGIWAEVLQVAQVGRDAHFFAHGGHSLLATRVVSRASEALGRDVPLRLLFEQPVLAAFARHLEAEQQPALVADAPLLQAGARPAALPLSFVQQRLWFLDQLQPGHAFYNVYHTVRLRGPLQVAVFLQGLRYLVRRHEVLRTTVGLQDGLPVQQIGAPEQALAGVVCDVRSLCTLAGEQEALRLARQEIRQPFDLARGPLLRSTLLRLGEQEYIWLLTLHHLIADEWSLTVLWQELAVCYTAGIRGQAPILPELVVQYADYALWQRAWLQGERRAAQEAYWVRQLQGAPTRLTLPTDRRRPALQRFGGATQRFRLPEALRQELQALSRREGVTLFMTLLAGFQILLSRLCGQEDIVVGTPIANRTRRDVEGMMGCFVNTLALRVRVEGRQRVRDLLRRVREVALEGYAHQELPFEQVVDALHIERALDHQPLVQALFVWQDPTHLPQTLESLTVELLPVDNGTAKFELSLIMGESPQGLWGELEYNSDLFAAETIARWLRQWQQLLERLVADPDGLVGDLDLLPVQERHLLLQEWNATTQAYPWERCLHELIAEQAARTPDAIALVSGGEQICYAVLEQQSTRLAHLLRRRGVGPEHLVGLCLDRSPELIVGLLGILKAGGAYLPLDPGYPAERVACMLQDGQVALVLTQRAVVGRVPLRQGVVCLVLEDLHEEMAQAPQTPVHSGVQPQNLAYVISTSGSTGRPKGASIQHRGLCSLAVAQQRAFALGTEDRVLQFASLSFDASIWEIVMALCNGASLHLESPHALIPGLAVLGDLRDQAITVATLPPSVLAALPAEEFPFLHTVISAGEACSPELMARWARGRRFFNAYGPSEASVCATMAVCQADAPDALSIGQPIANMQVYVLDHRRRLAPIGVAGELAIGGVGLARGYLGQPALTAERFVPHPFSQQPGERLYRSGDLVRMRADGALEFLGRLDQQVKLRGFRIEPGEIEATLCQHPQVREAVVVVREEEGERRLVAYLVASRPEQAPADSELRAWLTGRLPAHLLPAHLVLLDALPLLPNGKLDLRALPAPTLAAPQALFEAPHSRVEQVITAAWQEALHVERISVHDNFFDIGGHSLLLIRVCHSIQASLGQKISLIDMFRYTTIRSLASSLSQEQRQEPGRSETHRESPGRQRQLRRQHRLVQSSQGERHD